MADPNTNTQKTFIVLVYITIAGLATVPSYLRLPLIKGLDPYLHWSSNFLGSRMAAGCLLTTPFIVLLIIIISLYQRKQPDLLKRNLTVLYLTVIGFALIPIVFPVIAIELAKVLFDRFNSIFYQLPIPSPLAFYSLSAMVGIGFAAWGALRKGQSRVIFGLVVVIHSVAQVINSLTQYRWAAYIEWITTGMTLVIILWRMRVEQ